MKDNVKSRIEDRELKMAILHPPSSISILSFTQSLL